MILKSLSSVTMMFQAKLLLIVITKVNRGKSHLVTTRISMQYIYCSLLNGTSNIFSFISLLSHWRLFPEPLRIWKEKILLLLFTISCYNIIAAQRGLCAVGISEQQRYASRKPIPGKLIWRFRMSHITVPLFKKQILVHAYEFT